MITIVDYGIGNIGALINMLEYLGIEAEAQGDAHRISVAERLILPGVGSFDRAMRTLRTGGLVGPLGDAVLGRKVPVLGVCLGMQLLARQSEEGQETGLGWIAADVRRIVPQSPAHKVPHIGWADVSAPRVSVLFPAGASGERFYFDHSFVVHCDRDSDLAATFEYGQALACAVASGNVCGVQFHPEKSHRFGMRLLSDWARQDRP